MKILVTGATGFIGFEVSKHLSAMGLKPRLMIRRPDRGALISSLDAEIVQGDLLSEKSLKRCVKGVDAIIHLAARATFEDYDRLSPTIVKGSSSLIRAAADEGVKNFVYASSMLVYESQDDYIDQHTEPSPSVDYGRAKVLAENNMSKLAQETGMNLSILRLPHVYGPQDLLFDQVRKGYFLFPGSGENIFSHMHVEDCARLLVKCALEGWSGSSPVVDDYPSSWNEFFSTILEFYPRLKLYKIPKSLSVFGSKALMPLNYFSSKPTLATPGTIDGFNLNLKIKPGLVWDDLGIKPKYPTISEGIPAVLDGFVSFRWRHPIHDKVN